MSYMKKHAEEIELSFREHSNISREILIRAIGFARNRGGSTNPVGSYDIELAREATGKT